MKKPNKQIKIAVIGDIHDQWEVEDERALYKLDIDLVLFVGDFGNESVDVVNRIAALDLPKAVILGNHDAWYTASDWGRRKCPYDHTKEDRVQQQLDLLGKTHVGYGKLDFPALNLSVVGSRPFSWGGEEWKNEQFYRERFGVNNFQESTELILKAAFEAQCENLLILAHNGPFGLGDKPEDSCGRDWNPLGGDFGDPDLQKAIAQLHRSHKKIPLVTFGHMHHRLRHDKTRLRKVINKKQNETVYFNCASVPRIIQTPKGKLRNFSLVCLEDTLVSQISLIWLDEQLTVVSEKIFYDCACEFLLNHR